MTDRTEQDQRECCICGTPVTPPYHMLGGRVYCDRHIEAINRPNSGVWRAGLVQILGVGLLSAVIALLGQFLPPLSGPALVLAGVVLAIVPTALWLVFFYRQDRLEPEPKHNIFQVFLLAFLLADVLGVRLVRDWLQVQEWSTQGALISLIASILVLGITYQVIAYTAVRISVYQTPEFDERMDGIVYGTVAGLGIATLLNLRYVLENNGVALAPGVIRVATTTLALASFSGLMGYFMAQAKFEQKPIWWVPLGVAVAAVLNGVFSWLISEISAAGLSVNPWRSLVLGLVVALAVFALLIVLMRRVTTVAFGRART